MSDDKLGEARTEYAGLLGEGVKAFPPPKLAPGGFVVPGDPWLERGDAVGSWRIRLEGVLIFRAVNNETSTDALNGTVLDAVVEIENADGWKVQGVSAPYSLSQDGDATKYLAVQITSTKPLRL
jgi:hypothetical protein